MQLIRHKLFFYLFLFTFQSLVFVLPLIFIPNVFSPYEFPKFIFFTVAVELLAIFFTLYWLSGQNKDSIFPKIDLGVFLVVGFGLINLISNLLGVNPMISIFGNNFRHQGFLTLISGIIIFLLLRSSLSKKMLPIFRKTALASAFLVSSLAIWQVIQINIFHNYTIATYNDRIVGTLGNPNFLAGYLVMLLPFVLWYRQKISKLLKMTIVSIILLTIFYTDSRAAYLAVAFLFLVYPLLLILKLNIPRIVIGISVTLVFLCLFQFTDLSIYKDTIFKDPSPAIKERGCPESWPTKYPWRIITDIHNNAPVFKREALCDNRLLMWAVGLESLNKQPILGYGQDSFELAIPGDKIHKTDNAHNIFLETAISSGIIGLLFYLSILFYALRNASFDIKMSLIAFIIIGQFNPLSIAQISLFWILLGLSQKEKSFI